MSADRILEMLYEMSLLLSSETEPAALIDGILQRLLTHSACSAGFLLEYDSGAEPVIGVVSHTSGSLPLQEKVGQQLSLPRQLVTAHAEFITVDSEIAGMLGAGEYRMMVKLPVPQLGAFFLLAPTMPETDLPITEIFSPILKNFSISLRLRRKNEEKTQLIRSSRSLLWSILDTIPVRVFWKDPQGHYMGCNRLFAADAGYADPSVIVGLSSADMPWKDLAQDFSTADRKICQGEISLLQQEFDLQIATGNTIAVSSIRVPLHGPEGDILGVLCAYYDVSASKQMVQEMRKAKNEADQASQAKSEFLSGMSHELRTPLNAIIGYAQLLEANMGGNLDAEQLDEVHEIFRAGQHLLNLVNEILDFARVDTSGVDVTMEEINVADVIQECLSLLRPTAEQRDIVLHDRVSAGRPRLVFGDYLRLKQVIVNLISNAVKYNRQGGEVLISAESAGSDRLRILVSDTGPGLSSEQIGRLFRPFERLDARHSDIEGTGIGLVFSKHLMEMMGGSIGVKCALHQGCTFWVELGEASERVGVSASRYMEEQPRVTGDAVPDAACGLGTLTALYIEDNAANLGLVKKLLENRGATFVGSRNPFEGLELARKHRPDIILTDINMPGMDGFELLKQLRLTEELVATPVIAISANAMPADIRRAKKAGFDAYITKPLAIADFYTVLEEVCQRP